MMPRDTDAVKGAKIAAATVRRVWTFARPYRGTIIVFLAAILVAALLALVPPFVFREIIDAAIPDRDRQPIDVLAGLAAARRGRRRRRSPSCSAGAAPASARGSSTTCDGALFAKVQRMPVAFFTRTPTGVDHQPAEQRRRRRPDRGHQHARQRGQQRGRARHHAGRDAGPRVAAHPAGAGRAAGVHHPGHAGRRRLQDISREQMGTTPR